MRVRSGLLVLLLTLPGLASAQESRAVQTARQAAQASVAARGLTTTDLADLVPTDVVPDRSGSYVYLAQRVNGVQVWGTTTPVFVDATGAAVMSASTAFEAGIEARANDATPALDASSAIARAEQHVARLRPAPTVRRISDDAATDAAALAAATTVVYQASTPQLVYAPTEDGALRLAYALVLDAGGSEAWGVRVDAQTGAILAVDDLIDRDTWEAPRASAPRSLAPLSAPAASALGAVAANSSYRVVGMPFESPTHAPFSLVVNPANAAASPLGWHDTGSTQYTITRGNNGWAYLDRDDNDVADPSSSPDGGANLVFDAVFDPTQGVDGNQAPAVTSVFYWANIVHDVTWHYGFDEASGNYQTNNFGNGGAGNDAVRLEALDGSGTNNANFSPGSDGQSGRMQMYEWVAPATFSITAPADVAGVYPSGSGFGPSPNFSGPIVTAGPSVDTDNQACTRAAIVNDVTAKVALITRGGCSFVDKVRSAQAAGAAAVVIHNCSSGSSGCTGANPGETVLTMGLPDGDTASDITIPNIFVALSTGEILGFIDNVTVFAEAGINRDSDFDAGIVAHEYGHGISNRLVGGPSNSGCLGNAEQMGEGWSDYIGLMLTQQPGDTGAQRRGVGTYVEFEPVDGEGIRNAPYSTDFAINDYTYQDVISSSYAPPGQTSPGPRGLSRPHGIGFVWATMMWDMTWNLIEAHGYSPDVYNASGTAGNQIALNLYATGLRLTPCSPGFVGGRDAILAADLQLYPDANAVGGSAHYASIWRAFARRGLGVGASQGSATSSNDGTASFTRPDGVSPTASEQTAGGGTVRLDIAGPNPFSVSTTLALTVDAAQDVRVEVLDLLGRRVAVLHDGPVAPGASVPMRVSASTLPAGVYVVRAAGASFSLTERITVIR